MRLWIATALLAGCIVLPAGAKKPKKSPEPPDPPAMSAESETVIAMHRHMNLVEDMRKAVITGDTLGAREAARKLTVVPPLKNAPESWWPWLVSVKESAGRVEDTWDLEVAARTTGEIGRACGSCHRAVGANVVFEGDGDPGVAAPGLQAHMEHHARAAELMWQGLIVPDDTRYAQAARALAAAKLSEGDAAGDLDARIHDRASYGATVKGIAARADTYGSMLGTCQACHNLEFNEAE